MVTGRVSAASIEARLREMQRKLSAIAEIPKILSSTLATVSHTFDNMVPIEEQLFEQKQLQQAGYAHRKYSYDEDAIDYELSVVHEVDESESLDGNIAALNNEDELTEENEEEEEDNDDEDEAAVKDTLKRMAQSKLKDVTPESDYASEANYPANEASDEAQSHDGDNYTACSTDDELEPQSYIVQVDDYHDDGDDDDDEAKDDDDYVNAENDNKVVFYLKLPELAKKIIAAVSDDDSSSSIVDADADDVDDAAVGEESSNDTDDDFLSTTYTWNMRNVPKLCLNDENEAFNLTLNDGEQPHEVAHGESAAAAAAAAADDDISKLKAKPPPELNDIRRAQSESSQKVLFKLDNMERSWPWADRQKIIYKQSTCHLVPRRPIGLIEKRIQLLANKNLLQKLQQPTDINAP